MSTLLSLFQEVKPTFDGRFGNAQDAVNYIKAGRATITLRSQKTSNRYTYKIEFNKEKKFWWVNVLTNPDNVNGYSYLGIINDRGQFYRGKKSRIKETDTSVEAFRWSWERLANNTLPTQLEVWHEGICGRCGRKLTVPSSVETGFGPECVKKVGR